MRTLRALVLGQRLTPLRTLLAQEARPADRRPTAKQTAWSLSRILYSGPVQMIPMTEARARLSELLDQLERQHEHIVITRNGRPLAVLVPSAEYESMEETLEVLHDEPLLKALRESEADVRAGRLTSLDDVRRQLGLA